MDEILRLIQALNPDDLKSLISKISSPDFNNQGATATIPELKNSPIDHSYGPAPVRQDWMKRIDHSYGPAPMPTPLTPQQITGMENDPDWVNKGVRWHNRKTGMIRTPGGGFATDEKLRVTPGSPFSDPNHPDYIKNTMMFDDMDRPYSPAPVGDVQTVPVTNQAIPQTPRKMTRQPLPNMSSYNPIKMNDAIMDFDLPVGVAMYKPKKV